VGGVNEAAWRTARDEHRLGRWIGYTGLLRTP
jgi:hypothetical protein